MSFDGQSWHLCHNKDFIWYVLQYPDVFCISHDLCGESDDYANYCFLWWVLASAAVTSDIHMPWRCMRSWNSQRWFLSTLRREWPSSKVNKVSRFFEILILRTMFYTEQCPSLTYWCPLACKVQLLSQVDMPIKMAIEDENLWSLESDAGELLDFFLRM